MPNGIRIKKVTIKNLKGIRDSSITTNADFMNISFSDIVGIHGQNGSGKSTFINSISLLKNLLEGTKLPSNSLFLMNNQSSQIILEYEFLGFNEYGEYFLKYCVALEYGATHLMVVKESLEVRENELRRKYKNLISKDGDLLVLKTKEIQDINTRVYKNIVQQNNASKNESTSFIFREEVLKELFKKIQIEDIRIIEILTHTFLNNLYIISDGSKHSSHTLNPINNEGQNTPCFLCSDNLIPNEQYREILISIEQINTLLCKIIPGLFIIIEEEGVSETPGGELGTKFQLFSKRHDIKLPLALESLGILKIIKILSGIISVYNNPCAVVVIDNIDSNLFEYFYGELIDKINISGKGQFIFTAHTLRDLQILNNKNLWFTTSNPTDKFFQLKGVKELSNKREMYIRQLANNLQVDNLYESVSNEELLTAFEETVKSKA